MAHRNLQDVTTYQKWMKVLKLQLKEAYLKKT